MDETKILNNTETNISGITKRKKMQAPKAGENLRKSGLDIIGDVPSGTHLCVFYQSKEDLIDILVPYFKAGVENNEFCMWICWDPLRAEEARAALSKKLSELDDFIKKGQIEIVDYSRQQTEREESGFTKMKQFWIGKERLALERGFAGLRLAGNTYWLEKREWKDFKQYEEEVDDIIRSHKMLAICPYSLDKCGAPEIIDVIGNHKSALIKREGKWETIESSERKEAQEALRESQERYQALVENTILGITAIDTNYKIITANTMLAKLFNKPASDFVGKNCFREYEKREAVCPHCPGVRAMASGKTAEAETQGVRDDGSRFYVRNRAVPFFGSDGVAKGFIEIVEDITERKEAAEALRETTSYLENLFNYANAPIIVWDREFKIIRFNHAFEYLTGYAAKEIIGQRLAILFPKASKGKSLAGIERTLKGEHWESVEISILCKNGSIRVALWNSANIYGEDDKTLIATIAQGVDITERKKAEEAIKNMAKFPSENPHPVLRVTKDGKVLYSNKAGFAVLDKWKSKIGEKVPKRWCQIIMEMFISKNLKEEEEEEEVNGKTFSFVVAPVVGAGYVNLYVTNITERKKVEKTLKKSEEELRKDKLALEQKNLALKELIEHMERTKNKTKEDIAINIEESVMPILKKLRLKGLSPKYVDLLCRHLGELTSSFGRKITQRSSKLSSREIEICNLIKGGLHSKEISELLNVSYQTIDKHRRNIRKKLGISKRRANLTSFLQKL